MLQSTRASLCAHKRYVFSGSKLLFRALEHQTMSRCQSERPLTPMIDFA